MMSNNQLEKSIETQPSESGGERKYVLTASAEKRYEGGCSKCGRVHEILGYCNEYQKQQALHPENEREGILTEQFFEKGFIAGKTENELVACHSCGKFNSMPKLWCSECGGHLKEILNDVRDSERKKIIDNIIIWAKSENMK